MVAGDAQVEAGALCGNRVPHRLLVPALLGHRVYPNFVMVRLLPLGHRGQTTLVSGQLPAAPGANSREPSAMPFAVLAARATGTGSGAEPPTIWEPMRSSGGHHGIT